MKEQIIQLGPQYRHAIVTGLKKVDEADPASAHIMEFSFSGELPVQRGYWDPYMEILDHSIASSMRSDRINAGAPLLFNHDRDAHMGIVEKAWVDIGKRQAWSVVRFGSNELAQKKIQDIKDGILKNVSFAYIVHSMKLTKDGMGKAVDEYTSFDWEAYEISFVTVPADYTVGPERTLIAPYARHQNQQFACRVEGEKHLIPYNQAARSAASNRSPKMDEPTVDLAKLNERLNTLETASRVTREDNERTLAILGTAKANSEALGAGVFLEAEKFISEAKSIGDFNAHIMGMLRGRTAPISSTPSSFLGMSPSDVKAYSLAAGIAAMSGEIKMDAKEVGVVFEAQKTLTDRGVAKRGAGASFLVPDDIMGRQVSASQRDLLAGTATAGGYLVAVTPHSLIELLRADNILDQLGVRRLTGLKGDIEFPRHTGGSTMYWFAEAGTPTESNLTFGVYRASPKTVGGYVDISRKLLMNAGNVSVEALVTEDLAAGAKLEEQVVYFSGTGLGRPLGLLNLSGTGSITIAGNAVVLDDALEAEEDVSVANVSVGNLRFVTTPAVRRYAKGKLGFSGVAGPLWTDANTIAGYPAHVVNDTNAVPAGYLIGGCHDHSIIGEWGSMEVDVDLSAGFLVGSRRVRLLRDMDVVFRHAGAFSIGSGITS